MFISGKYHQKIQKTLNCSVLLNGEYGIYDKCIGVPVVIDKTGVKKIVKYDLDSKMSF